ncbi:MAG: Hpt domain-containing protein, partial [Pseudomonadota bacterium]|nr:Hpt domain-containing protein [Pseudomonadota bacterium]
PASSTQSTMESTMSASAEEESVLSIELLAQMRQDMPKRGINWLIDIFLSELPSYLKDLQQAIASGDGEHVYLKAHKFKGGCKNIGALRMISLCQRFETLGRAGDTQQAAQLMEQQLTQEVEALKAALEQEKLKES